MRVKKKPDPLAPAVEALLDSADLMKLGVNGRVVGRRWYELDARYLVRRLRDLTVVNEASVTLALRDNFAHLFGIEKKNQTGPKWGAVGIALTWLLQNEGKWVLEK